MPRVVVIEDSPLEQALVHGLLRRRWPELDIDVCGDIAAAMRSVGLTRPDAVLAHLPHHRSLELLETLGAENDGIPVVLMTGNRPDEMVLRTIRTGATHYVSGGDLGNELTEAVEKVLRRSRRNAAHRRLMGSLFHQDLRFSIENDLELVGPFVDYVRDHLERATPFPGNEINHVCLALHESLTNAINHGNLELSSDLRQEDEKIFYTLGEKRRREHPYRERRVYVAMMISAEEVDFRIRDEGPGFNVAAALARAEKIDIERIGGRGLLLIRSFMDTLSFNETGNEVRFSKRARHPDGAGLKSGGVTADTAGKTVPPALEI
jgi:anti-sigma regulatory factor (Ser/Thr protein kinase)/CheY-like chemotaxis protein